MEQVFTQRRSTIFNSWRRPNTDVNDIENIVLVETDGIPVYMRDIGEVKMAMKFAWVQSSKMELQNQWVEL